MKIISGSRRYKIPSAPPVPDPEEVAAREQTELNSDVERLKAQRAELKQELEQLRAKIPEWLCYLPVAAGSPQFMQRACAYLEKMRTRIEADGAKVWLDKDHDATTRVFNVVRFRVRNGGVYCSGHFTDPKYRDSFKGVSNDNRVFMGDFDLCVENAKANPPNCTPFSELPETARNAKNIFGLAGAVCLDSDPAFGRTTIFRAT